MRVFRSLAVGYVAAIASLWTGAGVAHAQDLPCTGTFGTNDFVEKMDAADQAMTAFELDRYRQILADVQDLLPCTYDRIHPNYLTRYGRQMAMAFFLDQDEMSMSQWATMATMAGTMPWPESMDETHPFREGFEMLEEPWLNGPEGAGVLPPKGGAVLLDGKILEKPVAAAETPHFIQLCDKRGLVLQSFWQEGSAFANGLLKADPTPPARPAWYKDPDPAVDPMKKVVLDEAAVAALKALQAEAEAEEMAEKERLEKQYAEQEQRAQKLEDREAKRVAKEEKKNSRNAEVEQAVLVQEDPVAMAMIATPQEWMGFSFEEDREKITKLDRLEQPTAVLDCADLLKLEPKALLGRLGENEIQCLEQRLRHTARVTMQDKISRVLMADAWAKNQPHRWEAAIRRHLTEIDRSDADLCYIYSRHLVKGGTERVRETIRWSEIALINARSQWNGETLVRRVYGLHRMKSLAAQQKWYEEEQEFLRNSSREVLDRATRWRNITKTLSREWLEFARASNMPVQTPFEVCVSAAGTVEFCNING